MVSQQHARGNDMDSGEIKVKGEAMLSIPIFIIKKFGQEKYKRWLNSLSPEAKLVYGNPIAKGDWFPIGEMLTEPTRQLCELFYNSSLRGAWDCGRYSAEYGLKGVYRVLVKLRSPLVLIRKAEAILPAYYKPCEIEVVDHSSDHVVILVRRYPGFDDIIVNRIGGWMERAVEITGCKHVSVTANPTSWKFNPAVEYKINWR